MGGADDESGMLWQTVAIPAGHWASMVASVSKYGENAKTVSIAKRLHGEG